MTERRRPWTGTRNGGESALDKVVLTGVGAMVTEVDVTVVVEGVIERQEQALDTWAEAY